MNRWQDTKRPAIIYVEDNDSDFAYISGIVKKAGFRVVRAESHRILPQVMIDNPHTLGILSDVDTPELRSGLEWAQQYRQVKDHKPFTLISLQGIYGADAKAMGVGFHHKPGILDGAPYMPPDMPESKSKILNDIVSSFERHITDWLETIRPQRRSGSPLTQRSDSADGARQQF